MLAYRAGPVIAEAEEPGAVHVALVFLDQGPDEAQPRIMADVVVELVVQRVEQAAVIGPDRLVLARDQRIQRVQMLVRQTLGGVAQAAFLKRAADEIGLQHRLFGNRRDRGGALRDTS